MKKFYAIKKSAWLRRHTNLRPVFVTETRWSSAFLMVERYFQLKLYFENNDRDIVTYLLSPSEDLLLESVSEKMTNFESVSKKTPGRFCLFGDARALFDSLQEVHPDLVYYLGLSDNSICKNVDFGRTLVISVTGQELSVHDRQMLSKLFVNQENHVAGIDLANDDGSFAERAFGKKKQEMSI